MHSTLALLSLLSLCPQPSPAPHTDRPSRSALDGLAAVVRSYVEEQRVPGAVLLAVHAGQPVLYEAFGQNDLQELLPMERDLVFNIRSMTKPVLGTVVQTLIDDGRLSLGDPVALHLPAFAGERTAAITVEHLLGHRAGLGWNLCMDGASLTEMAECCARVGPREFVPGTSFLYSNAGSNVLAALVEAVCEAPLEGALDERVITPLGLADTFALDDADDPRLARCARRYVRSEEDVQERSWAPGEGAPLDFLQGAQGLGSTVLDYARFLSMWMHDGTLDGERILSPEAVQRGLTPAALTELPTTFPGRRVYYGQHWKLWSPGDSGVVEAFGHSGSDGTFAWAFPGRDLLVLYFTQAVNTETGIELEAEIDRWLLEPTRAPVPDAFRGLVGTYWNDELELPRYIYVDAAGALAIDVVGTGGFTLAPGDDPRTWSVVGRNDFLVQFELDDEGVARSLQPPVSTGESAARRLEPAPDLPSVDALMALRFGGEASGSLAELGVFRMEGTFTHSSGLEGRDVLISDGERRAREEVYRSKKRGPEVTIVDGERAFSVSPRGKVKETSGAEREALVLGRMAVIAGDWRRYFAELEVLARARLDEREVIVVRARGAEGPPTTFFVDAETGRARRMISSVPSPFGALGKTTELEDEREIRGLWLPFRWTSSFAAESLGSVTVQYASLEPHIDPPPDTFVVQGRDG